MLFTAAAALCAAATAAAADTPAKPYDFSGPWHSSAGAVRIEQAGSDLKATYVNPDGHITATVIGRTADGYWMTASPSKHRCAQERDGTRYWGHVRVTAAASGKSFAGRVSFCEDAFDAPGSRKWSARRD
jgi:hypothetical protein